MARVHFTQNLQRHVDCPVADAPGSTVRQVLDSIFAANPRLAGYVLDEHGSLRKHMVIFVDGQAVTDRDHLNDPANPTSEIYVMQALSGG